jgi:hypothetical protein
MTWFGRSIGRRASKLSVDVDAHTVHLRPQLVILSRQRDSFTLYLPKLGGQAGRLRLGACDPIGGHDLLPDVHFSSGLVLPFRKSSFCQQGLALLCQLRCEPCSIDPSQACAVSQFLKALSLFIVSLRFPRRPFRLQLCPQLTGFRGPTFCGRS